MPAAATMMAPPAKPTYAVMVSDSIKALGDRTGSSVQAITKHLMAQYSFDINKHALSKAIKKGVASGNLVQIKSSYKLAKPIKPAPKKAAPAAKKKAPVKAKASTVKKSAPKKVSAVTRKATSLKPVKTLKKRTAVKESRPIITTKKAGTSSTTTKSTRKAPAAKKKTARK